MSQFNLGWVPLIQQELRKFFASKGQGDKADTALQPGAIGTTVQGYDADLSAIAALPTTGLIDRTGAGTATTRATGATGLSVLAAANAAAARTAIGAMANTVPEIITNANGRAYRWPNGLQICTFTGVSQNATLLQGSIYATSSPSNWTYPAAFNSSPTCSGCQDYISNRWVTVTAGSTTVATYRTLGALSDATLGNPYLFAIGTYTP